MKNIILEAQNTKAVAFDVADLQAEFTNLTDPRNEKGKVYPLPMLLTLILLAKLSGQDKPSSIAHWIRLREEWLSTLFEWDEERMPCLNTIRDTLKIVSLDELSNRLRQYLHTRYGGGQSQLISIDGKTMRGTIPKGKTQGVHLLAAYIPDEGVVLAQVEVGAKENEISAAPKLLEQLDLKERVVCADAMQTQRQLSTEILARGGDYIWPLKGNQSTALEDVSRFFDPIPDGCSRQPLPQTTVETVDRGHGRKEIRRLTLIADEITYLDWPGVQQVFRLEREVYHLKSQKKSHEVVYGVTSCDPQTVSADQLLALIRGYWGIENGLHYRRDVTLYEDLTRFAYPKMAQVMATLNNFIVGLGCKLGYTNLASARRIFDSSISQQLFSTTHH